MFSKLLVSALLASQSFVLADELHWWTVLGEGTGKSEYWTCDDITRESFVWDYVAIGNTEYASYYDAQCDYPPAVGSILLCAANYAKNDTILINKIFSTAADACVQYTDYHRTADWMKEQYQNATEYYVPLANIANTTYPLYSPSKADPSLGEETLLGYFQYYYNLDSGTWFSVALCGYFLLLVLIGSIYNFVRVSGMTRAINNSSVSKLAQKYVIFPALLTNGKFQQYYGYKWASALFPNRVEFIVDLFLFGLQMGFYCAPYYQSIGFFYGSTAHSWQRYIADRTGVMAFGKIPLLVLFAGRNNFLLFITGWSQSTFLHFHKVLALWMTLDVLIHSVAYTVMELGSYVLALQDVYFACGVAATVFSFLICGFAIHSIRNNFYQLFLFIHVLFAIAFIIMCWYHCNILGWCEWLIAACAVWFFDRLVRVFRIIAVGSKQATITAVDDDLLKVEMEKPSSYSIHSGQYAYLYFGGLCFWENNPFTIVCKNNKLTAYIRVKKGITKSLLNKALTNGGTLTKNVFIEGPYSISGGGGINKMDDLLLIAGGAGAPAILDAASTTTKGKLIWVAKKVSNVKAYSDLLKEVSIETDVYITQESGENGELSVSELVGHIVTSDSNSSDDVKIDDVEKASVSHLVNIIYGRPNLDIIINDYVNSSLETNIGVNVCGPPQMSDSIRGIVASNVTNWKKSVNYFDELQVW